MDKTKKHNLRGLRGLLIGPKFKTTLLAKCLTLRSANKKKRKHVQAAHTKKKNTSGDRKSSTKEVNRNVAKKKSSHLTISNKPFKQNVNNQNDEIKIDCNENHRESSDLPEGSVLGESVAPQHLFASNYQQLVIQAMERNGLGCQSENVIPVKPLASFQNNYQHLVTNALSLDKGVRPKTKGRHGTATNLSDGSVASMLRHGLNDVELTATPNDRSHIPQFTDIGVNGSVAEFSRCGPSGPAYNSFPCYESEEEQRNSQSPMDRAGLNYSIWPGEESEFLETSKEPVVKTTPIITFHLAQKNKFVCVMKHPAVLFFHGQLKIQVLTGSLSVLGFTLTSDRKESSAVYSPAGFSQLGLQTVNSCRTFKGDEITLAKLRGLGLDSKVAGHIFFNLDQNDCVALIEKASCPFAAYLASNCSIYLYPRSSTIDFNRPFMEQEKKLQCEFNYEYETTARYYKEPQEWTQIVNTIIKNSHANGPNRVMICGGKSVGKSTLLRFVVNQCLATMDEVLCLDFDPGQAEFNVPGSVCVVRVNKPLLGPNFTHLHTPERLVYIGDVDISKCPDQYIKAAQHIVEYCLSQPDLKQMVWVVNTMGFIKGIGVDLMENLIHLVNPSQVVQIQSKSPKNNYPSLLTSSSVSQQKSKWRQVASGENRPLDYLLHIIPTAVEEKQPLGSRFKWGLPSKALRNIMILAYFHQMLKPPRFSLIDIVPHKTSFSELTLGVCHESVHYSQLLNVMNANLVALCNIPNNENVLEPDNPELPRVLVQPPIGPCLGFGVVRGVDVEQRQLYLITPLPDERLKQVNCLLAGNVTLPACLYMHSSSGLGHMPYVARVSDQTTNDRIERRFKRPMKRKAGKD